MMAQRLSRMRQVVARAEHNRGLPPPPGYEYDPVKQIYVEIDHNARRPQKPGVSGPPSNVTNEK